MLDFLHKLLPKRGAAASGGVSASGEPASSGQGSGASGGARPERRPGQGKPFLEIQYHPSDIRKGVRYLFLSRKQVAWMVTGLVAYLGFLGFAASVTPEAVRKIVAEHRYEAEMEERQMHGERLKLLVHRLGELGAKSEDVRIEMSKIYLAYGLPEAEARGKGGYPHVPDRVPQSIYAGTIRRGNGLLARVGEEIGVLSTFLQEVQSFEEANRGQVRETPSISPLRSQDFVLTSPYGLRTSPFTKEVDFHAGVDMAAPIGTPVYAPADGVVAFAGRYPLRQSVGWWRYGNMVALRHGERFVTLYGHCDEVKVRGGQTVKQGDVIATVGDTGWSTNPHLHYEIRRLLDDEEGFHPVDPRIYILDHRWRDEEKLLIRARRAPDAQSFEPLPRTMRR